VIEMEILFEVFLHQKDYFVSSPLARVQWKARPVTASSGFLLEEAD
jgi:hypothetical protein